MTAASITSAPRSCAALLAVLCVSLTLAPAATASMITAPPDRMDDFGSVRATPHVAVVLPPDRVDRIGGPVAVHTAFIPPPDRVDGVGTSRFTSVSTGTSTPSGVIRASSSFDWTAAFLGGLAGLGIALVAMAAWLGRNRRDVALPS